LFISAIRISDISSYEYKLIPLTICAYTCTRIYLRASVYTLLTYFHPARRWSIMYLVVTLLAN